MDGEAIPQGQRPCKWWVQEVVTPPGKEVGINAGNNLKFHIALKEL